MTCPECAARQRLLAEAEALLRDKRFKYSHTLHEYPFMHARLLGSYERDVKAARENVESHRAVCTEEKR